MKTFFLNALLILLCLSVSSCEKEDFNLSENVANDFNATLSRSGNDFDPISELSDNGVLIYIKNKGKDDSYMSTISGNYFVQMEKEDDGSGRQRWLLNGRAIYSVSPQNFGISLGTPDNGESFCPFMVPYTLMGQNYAKITTIPNSQYYEITIGIPIDDGGGIVGPMPTFKTAYLQRQSSGSDNLIYGYSNIPDWAKWEIVPYGNYTIEDIEYTFYDGGSLDSASVAVDTYTLDNTHSSVPVKRSWTVTTTVENTSTFSNTEGVSTSSSLSSSTSVGLPLIDDVLNFNSSSSISSSITNTTSFSQGETTRKTKTISETYEMEVPAYTFYRLETIVKSYKINVRYIATLKGDEGTTFRVKGVWNGVQAAETYQKAYNQTTGETEVINPRPIE
mgnify:CR=1 FL=1